MNEKETKTEFLLTTFNHLQKALKNFDYCEASCSPGFDDGLVEVMLAIEALEVMLFKTDKKSPKSVGLECDF